MAQFEEKDMVRSEEKEMVEHMCHPPSNPIISKPTLKRGEPAWERVLNKFIGAIMKFMVAVAFLMGIGAFFMAIQEPEGEKRKELVRASAFALGTAVVCWKSIYEAEELYNEHFGPDLEVGLPSEETSLIDIGS